MRDIHEFESHPQRFLQVLEQWAVRIRGHLILIMIQFGKCLSRVDRCINELDRMQLINLADIASVTNLVYPHYRVLVLVVDLNLRLIASWCLSFFIAVVDHVLRIGLIVVLFDGNRGYLFECYNKHSSLPAKYSYGGHRVRGRPCTPKHARIDAEPIKQLLLVVMA